MTVPLTPLRRPEDVDAALRPQTLDDFVGQAAARENLRVFIAAARGRGEALDHVLFHGPPGLAAPLAQPGSAVADALSALANLGFRPLDASRAVAEEIGRAHV